MPGALPFPSMHHVHLVPSQSERLSLLQAYRQLAKQHHPDKGGDPTVFARVQVSVAAAACVQQAARDAALPGLVGCYGCRRRLLDCMEAHTASAHHDPLATLYRLPSRC